MSIKIIHTADNHIGISYNSLQSVKDKLLDERFNSIKKIVAEGNKNNCDFLIVSGDLFDKTTVTLTNIKKVIEILKDFNGEVLITPGNHDFFEDEANTLWSKFKENSRDYNNIVVLTKSVKHVLEANELKINFYPAPCRSKHSSENAIGWIKNEAINKNEINIGIAHGNVYSLGRDEKNNYFNMTKDELKATDIDFWLLGHIHVTYPTFDNITQNPNLFMAGTHMPDSWKSTGKGNAWIIEVDNNKNVKAKKFAPSLFEYVSIEKTINSINDITELSNELNGLEKQHTALNLNIKGRLSQFDSDTLNTLLLEFRNNFLYYEDVKDIQRLIDHTLINETYPDASIPHALLTQLLNEGDNLAVQMVYETLKTLKKI